MRFERGLTTDHADDLKYSKLGLKFFMFVFSLDWAMYGDFSYVSFCIGWSGKKEYSFTLYWGEEDEV